jgi:hypothetical protein
MRTFSATTLGDGSALPWVWPSNDGTLVPIVWGVNLIAGAVYAFYSEATDTSPSLPIGDPISFTWSALLDPADTPLPDWITETTHPIVPIGNPFDINNIANNTLA